MINWKPIEELPEEYKTNQKEVLLKTFVGVVSAWAHISTPMKDEWFGGGTTYYDWVCYDDMFTLDFDDSTITHFAEFNWEDK